ncbi:proline racemase [Clostridia bacterium]|nr:proline racemase [Clostridia bacterium]
MTTTQQLQSKTQAYDQTFEAIKTKAYDRTFETIDSHTMGEATRIILSGFPPLTGKTMMEQKRYLEDNYDHYRTALMLEPRGHNDMFGALLVKPVSPKADFGVIFMDGGGYLNMCGHGSIGAAMAAVETGMVDVKEPFTEVVLEAPSGIVRALVKVENGRAKEVSVYNVPAFLYMEDVSVEVEGYGAMCVDIAFGGSFFALVDAGKLGIEISTENIDEFISLGIKLRHKINQTIAIRHPNLDITTVDLVEFYGPPDNPNASQKNVVVFGNGQVDRCPCGTGTSAKLAELYAHGKLALGEEIINESITGSLFKGKAVSEVKIESFSGVIPCITGNAYITGFNQWVLDSSDPLELGFRV